MTRTRACIVCDTGVLAGAIAYTYNDIFFSPQGYIWVRCLAPCSERNFSEMTRPDTWLKPADQPVGCRLHAEAVLVALQAGLQSKLTVAEARCRSMVPERVALGGNPNQRKTR